MMSSMRESHMISFETTLFAPAFIRFFYEVACDIRPAQACESDNRHCREFLADHVQRFHAKALRQTQVCDDEIKALLAFCQRRDIPEMNECVPAFEGVRQQHMVSFIVFNVCDEGHCDPSLSARFPCA